MEHKKPSPTYLPLAQVARLVGVPRAWLKTQSERGTIPHLQAGRTRLYRHEEVLEALAKLSLTAGGAVDREVAHA